MTVAVLDACVLYPPSLRDLLMHIAVVGAYKPKFTNEIHAEWIRNVLINNVSVSHAQLDRTRLLMNQVTPDCLVTGHEALIGGITLPDPNDRHILAAAIKAKAKVIVTYNLADFTENTLLTYRIEAAHPDDFLTVLFDEQTHLVLQAVRQHRASLKNPPKTTNAYIETLIANRLIIFASRNEPPRGKPRGIPEIRRR